VATSFETTVTCDEVLTHDDEMFMSQPVAVLSGGKGPWPCGPCDLCAPPIKLVTR